MEIITIENFKNYFRRDFPFLPTKVEDKVYFKGDIIYVAPNFYESLIDNNTSDIDDIEAWGVINGNEEEYLSDFDIEKAIAEMQGSISDVFEKEIINIAQYYLTAYYLVIDIKNSESGLNSTAYSSFVASKSVGGVSESYAIPSWVNNDPVLSLYLDNGYGKKYLTYLLPRIKANSFILSCGATTI